ncbi:hypothetical protein [Laedolimicola ammoniilytica]|uniref:Uncharacterized protein n=1 Tax=Laedolimicola ammoniilytica TaxID=2981771 RepID=A0ABT2S1R2_9FIRM|nr:hypothetical protein [Laedolimicola ammoniilytica]MCU6698529.1 hypothetical protein [Laedolimicola ammoniilytica]SCI89564.1 Uncharacterised protein [uncultured Clostridium sp.]
MHNRKVSYRKNISQILNSVNFIQEVNNDQEMGREYIDEYTTKQQRLRDEKITELLTHYVEAYQFKIKSNKWYKGILLGICILILLTFCIVFVILMFRICITKNEMSAGNVAKLISVCVTFLTLIVGIMTIITKYVFPENEEEYITRIVEIIQNNDLEHKKENIRVKSMVQSEEVLKDIQTKS